MEAQETIVGQNPPTSAPMYLTFSEEGRRRYDEVQKFLSELPEDGEHTAAIREEFAQRIKYLREYGGDRFRVELHSDWAPLSFSIVWFVRTKDGEWRFAFNGGLIWHGGSNDPLTVSLTPQWWGIHT